MEKNKIFEKFVKDFCSPKDWERDFITEEYLFLKEYILDKNIFQSGSYKRFTAITPVNDLDVIWVISEENQKNIGSGELSLNDIIKDLADKIAIEYKKFHKNISITQQDHSVKIDFNDRKHKFSIDVVPALKMADLNLYKENFYKIPENNDTGILWKKTDPKGYIKEAQDLNERNKSFRKVTKFLKAWRRSWRSKNNFGDVEFKIKSFHIEQIVRKIIVDNNLDNSLEIVMVFFQTLEDYLTTPQFPDKADNKVYIDSYIIELTEKEKKIISIAQNSALVLMYKLDDCEEEGCLIEILHRLRSGEEFIEAYGYSRVANQTPLFYIRARVNNETKYDSGLCNASNGDAIIFTALFSNSAKFTKNKVVRYHFKIKNTGIEALNDNALRGEIFKVGSNSRKEDAKYKGMHYVEAYAIDSSNNVVAQAICSVRID